MAKGFCAVCRGSDNLVRIETRRLRRVLDKYYETQGNNDPVHISIGTISQRSGGSRQSSTPPFHRPPNPTVLPLCLSLGQALADNFNDRLYDIIVKIETAPEKSKRNDE